MERPFRKANVRLKRFKVSDSQFLRKAYVHLKQIKTSDLEGIEFVSATQSNDIDSFQEGLVSVVCWVCDQPFPHDEKSTQNLKDHILQHYEYIFDDLLPSAVPFNCPECEESFSDKIMLMRHFGFTHKKIYQLTELTPNQLVLLKGRKFDQDPKKITIIKEGDDEPCNEFPSSSDEEEDQAVFLCPFQDCSLEFTFEDMKYGPAAKHMRNVHGLLPGDLRAGQYKFVQKLAFDYERREHPVMNNNDIYLCPFHDCDSEFSFDDLRTGRAAQHMRQIHWITPSSLKSGRYMFVKSPETATKNSKAEAEEDLSSDYVDGGSVDLSSDSEDNDSANEELISEDCYCV